MARDSVCGMECDENTARFKTEYQGETYYFCAPICMEMFDKTQKNTWKYEFNM